MIQEQKIKEIIDKHFGLPTKDISDDTVVGLEQIKERLSQDLKSLIESEVEEEVKFLYKEYAEEDDNKLHESAKPIKKNLLKLIDSKWISVETPPNHEKDVIVWYSENNKDIALYYKEKDEWLNTRSQKVKPKKWMEFPQ